MCTEIWYIPALGEVAKVIYPICYVHRFLVTNTRYPIETWSRPQLEDHFHNVVEELQNSQKKVKEQEKQITTFNSRFRRNLLERKNRDEKVVERSKYDDVVKENQILDMKLKAAKQQLLIYTAPSARATTASLMTGRSTFRQPPSTWRQRQPLTGSIDRPASAQVIRKKPDGGDKLQLATDEKLTIVRLNRTLKNKNDEISELKYTIEKLRQNRSSNSAPPSRDSTSSSKSSSSSTSNNNNDDDVVDSELEEMRDESARSTPVIEDKKPRRRHSAPKNEVSRVPDQSEKMLMDKLKIAENDLQISREECELMKKANERLVQQSLSKSTEYGARESIEEKKKIVELEEQLKDSEKRIRESEHKRRDDQKKFEAMTSHYRTKYENLKKQKVSKQEVKVQDVERSDSPPPIIYEPVRKRSSTNELNRMRRQDDDLLQKLYREVADILQSHDIGISEISSLPAGENTLNRWQKLYAELYEELEKIRNMLVVQYDINHKQTVEIKLLKAELERLKTVSSEILTKAREEVEEKQKKIYMLEEQIRTIAYSGQKPVKLLANQISIPSPRLNTDLSVKLIHVKPAPSLTSKFFFSLEFFDFQLETTPIMDPKQQNMDFTTVYDVLVSNLLIHYLQTNGISIEMYRPASDCYKLLAAGTISLIPLFEDEVLRKFCSEIVLKSVENGNPMCTLRYEIDISQPISDGLRKFTKSEVARSMLPLKLEPEEKGSQENNFEPLTIMVNRVSGLHSLGKDPKSEYCVVYEFLSFSPYFTDFSSSSEIQSKRDCYIPKTDAVKNLFATSNISFFLIENIPKQDGVLATLHLPLHPLCKLGGSIKGSFPMLDTSGRPSPVSLDLCLIWKHEIPSFFLKPEPKKVEESDTSILPQSVRRTSKTFDVTPVKDSEPILREEIKEPVAVVEVEQKRINPEIPIPFGSPSSENSSSSKEFTFSPPEKKQPLAFDFNLSSPPLDLEHDEHDEPDRIVFEEDDDEEDEEDGVEENEIESVSAISSHRDLEPQLDPPIRQLPEPSTEITETSEDLTPRVPVLVSEPESEEIPNSRESTPVTQRSVEEKEIEEEKLPEKVVKTEEKLESLLGVLPPIAKPRNIPVGPISLNEQEIQKPRRGHGGTGRIEFTEPLHHSVPPSESSTSSSPRAKPPVPLPEYDGHSLIKVPKPISPIDKDVLEPDMRITIQLETFEIEPGPMEILARQGNRAYIDWIFLDFSREESTGPVFEVPRRAQECIEIPFTKEYTLTRGQVSLLSQWIELKIKLEFTLIRVGSNDDDELANAQILIIPNNSQNKSILLEFIKGDISGERMAEVQMTLHFSKALLEALNGY